MIQAQAPHQRDNGSEESNSLEGSHGLHHFSNNSSERPPSSEQLQMSGSFSSSAAKNNNNNSQSEVMQQELDDFAKIFHGDLTKEEQELVSQLTAQANQNLNQNTLSPSGTQESSMDLNELRNSSQHEQRHSHN